MMPQGLVLVLGALTPWQNVLPQRVVVRSPSVRRHPGCRLQSESDPPHARLILVRHGQSEWNRANRFTGWVDVDLTEQGITEAREAGRLLAAQGLEVDVVHTSFMRRAIRSAVLMLSTLNQCWVPVRKHPELNEQHSGMLTGQNKRELAKEHGADQVMAWRRKCASRPRTTSQAVWSHSDCVLDSPALLRQVRRTAAADQELERVAAGH